LRGFPQRRVVSLLRGIIALERLHRCAHNSIARRVFPFSGGSKRPLGYCVVVRQRGTDLIAKFGRLIGFHRV
jgi:hypothetical protein